MLPSGCRCYLINLDRSPERLATMTARLDAVGIAFERVPGVDGLALSEQEFERQTRLNRYYKPLRRGEVGCFLGHVEVMRRFVASGQRYALVLEDDALLPPELPQVLSAAIAQRDRVRDPVLAWDVLKLIRRRRRHVDLAPIDDRHRLVEYGLSVPTTTTAAVWTRDGAERWLRHFDGVTRPVDCDLQHPWESGIRILSVHPASVDVEGESVMGSPHRETRNPWPKLRYEAARIWPKLRHFGTIYGWGLLLRWPWSRRLAYHAPPQG